jgi:hypothetical protein
MSNLLKYIVPELSFLDVICWIADIGFTVVYKLVKQTPPFPKGDEYVQAINSMGSWEELGKAFGQTDYCSHLNYHFRSETPSSEPTTGSRPSLV